MVRLCNGNGTPLMSNPREGEVPGLASCWIRTFVLLSGSDVGKWFMENMYVNLGLEIKRYIDADKTRNAREKLLLAYDALATVACYFSIYSLSDFSLFL